MGRYKKLKPTKLKKMVVADNQEKARKNTNKEIHKPSSFVRSELTPSALFFEYNTQLGPPYFVLVDTNFINFSIQNKLDLFDSLLDCLCAKTTACITDCVIGELEKFDRKYRIALRIAKDPRFKRFPCLHKGTYADDCIIQRITQHRCYIVATCDRDLRRRIRKIPGVPIMYISNHKYTIERMPDDYGGKHILTLTLLGKRPGD